MISHPEAVTAAGPVCAWFLFVFLEMYAQEKKNNTDGKKEAQKVQEAELNNSFHF